MVVHKEDATDERDLYPCSDSDSGADVSLSSDVSDEESDQRKLHPTRRCKEMGCKKRARQAKRKPAWVVSPTNKENQPCTNTQEEPQIISQLEPTEEEKEANIKYAKQEDGLRNQFGVPFVAVAPSMRLQRPPPVDASNIWGVIPRFRWGIQTGVCGRGGL